MAKKKKDEGGMSVDDAFADDEDVEYAKSKPRKIEKKEASTKESSSDDGELIIKSSKPVEKIKKGDKIKVDSLMLEVDAHYVLIDHGSTKEMTIELFDPKTDKDYQLRYFSGQVDTSLEFYKLEEIVYNKMPVKKIEW